jgi:pyruvate dehydrogenase E2 component (dihydrolipoamide acetyltransferase)
VAEVTEVTVPDIGDFSDVPVIEVLVEPGQEVIAEEPLIVLESDKATMEVPSPAAGVVQDIRVKVGDKLSQGALILTLASSDGAAPVEEVQQPEADAGTEATTEEPPPPPASVQAAAPAARDSEPPAGASEAPARAAEPGGETPYASPSVRRLARENGVDLASISGSGRKGRITAADVEAAAGGKAPSAAVATGDGGLGLAPWPSLDFEKYGPTERVPLTRIQKLSGPALARNWVRIPHVTHNDEADITDLEAFRKKVNSEQQDVKATMVALLLKASVASLKAYPQLNSSLDGDELVLKRYYHLGFAADTPQGLIVPVIRDVDQKGLLAIAGELTELSAKARAGKIGPADIGGSTFTISSLGGIGGTSFTPIVNAPEVAILGVTRSAMKPVWDGSAFVPRQMVPLSLSYDHRVIDGALAARFVAHLAGVLGDMKRVLL